MKAYIHKDFDQALPEKDGFKESFQKDKQEVEKMGPKNKKEIANLITRIENCERLREKAAEDVQDLPPEGSCFQKNFDLVLNSLRLDERAQKRLMHHYVQSVIRNK